MSLFEGVQRCTQAQHHNYIEWDEYSANGSAENSHIHIKLLDVLKLVNTIYYRTMLQQWFNQ